MTPCFPGQQLADRGLGDSELSSSGCLGLRVSNLSYGSDLIVAEFPSTQQLISPCSSSFSDHVLSVIPVRSNEQVIGANTDGIVAAMKNQLALGDWPDVQLVGEAMGVYGPSVSITEPSVDTEPQSTTSPCPASLGGRQYLRPETFGFVYFDGPSALGHLHIVSPIGQVHHA